MKRGVGYCENTDCEDYAKGVFLLDVRELSEFHGELGRVPGSVLVPLGELAAKVGEWERGRPIVTICRSGERSLSAAHVLREAGFREVASMRGGMLAWGSAGLPTTRG